MSILIDLKSELRRIMIAGGELAAGDARLSKLGKTFSAMGEKVPVFARISSELEKLTGTDNAERVTGLLELSVLNNAVVYTQASSGKTGELRDFEAEKPHKETKSVTYRAALKLKKALITKGADRFEIIKQAIDEGYALDARFLPEMAAALGDTSPHITDLVSIHLHKFGAPVLKYIKEIDTSKNSAENVLKLKVIDNILEGEEHRKFFLEIYENSTGKMKIRALRCLSRHSDEDVKKLAREAFGNKSEQMRLAGFFCLARLSSDIDILETVRECYHEAQENYKEALKIKTEAWRFKQNLVSLLSELFMADNVSSLALIDEELERVLETRVPTEVFIAILSSAKTIKDGKVLKKFSYKFLIEALEISTKFFEGGKTLTGISFNSRGKLETKTTECVETFIGLLMECMEAFIGLFMIDYHINGHKSFFKDIPSFIPRFDKLLHGFHRYSFLNSIFRDAYEALTEEEFQLYYLPLLNKSVARGLRGFREYLDGVEKPLAKQIALLISRLEF